MALSQILAIRWYLTPIVSRAKSKKSKKKLALNSQLLTVQTMTNNFMCTFCVFLFLLLLYYVHSKTGKYLKKYLPKKQVWLSKPILTRARALIHMPKIIILVISKWSYLLRSTKLSTISLKKYCQKSLKNMIRNGKWKSWCTRSVMCGSSKKISFHHHLLQEVGEVFVSYHIQQEDPGARWAEEQWEHSFFLKSQ